MNIKRGKITLEALQIKSLDKARKLAQALTIIEEECGIHEVRITLKDMFICPWIGTDQLNETPMEKLLRDIFNKEELDGR